jgi:apolipoprotein N-acyltransferase
MKTMKKEIQNLLLVVLSAVMMSAGWWRLTGLVMLGGLVPLLVVAARYGRSKREFWRMAGWTTLFIVLWYAMTIWWVWNSTPAGPVAATFFALLYIGVPFMLWFFVSKRTPKALSYTILVAIWTVGEWYYNWNQASFPWLNIGNGFAHDVWLVQWYEWTGVYGGTIWVLVTNLLIYEFLVVRRTRKWWPVVVAVVAPVVVSLVIYFTYNEPTRAVEVTVVQPNIDPYKEKFTISQTEQTANLLELMSEAPKDVDFIVMPETAIDENLMEGNLASSESVLEIRSLAEERYPGATVIVGATTYKLYGTTPKTKTARGNAERGYYDVYNTALAIDPEGKIELHHKSKLVIGVEMMPDWWWVKYLNRLVVDLGGTSGQLGYDTVRKVFNSGETYGGAAICYESIYGEYFTEFVRGGAEVMFIITNDGWWGDTPGYQQHFDYARLRAIETRRAIARSANTGRSGFINTRGDVGQTLGWKERGTITAEVPLNRTTTFYVRYGDYLARISLLVLGLGLLYFIAYRIRKRDHIVQ